METDAPSSNYTFACSCPIVPVMFDLSLCASVSANGDGVGAWRMSDRRVGSVQSPIRCCKYVLLSCW